MAETFGTYSKNYNEHINNTLSITGYDTDSLTKAKLIKLQQLFPSLVHKKLNLLDFGCGIGNLYESVKQYFPFASYIGVDKSAESLIQAQSRFANDSIFQGLDSEKWKNLQYDLIFAAGVFHHIAQDEHENILKELFSLLKPHGKLVIWEHNALNPFTRKLVNDCIFDQNAVLVKPGWLKKIMLEIRFSNIQVVYTTFFPKVLSCLNALDPYLGWFPLGGQYIAIGEKP